MDTPTTKSTINSKHFIETVIRLIALILLFGWCFKIIEPFITPLLWGCILAVAIFPVFNHLKKQLKGRDHLAAIIITLFFLLLIILPAGFLSVKMTAEIKHLTELYNKHELSLPVVPEKVKSWPIIGSKLHSTWSEANDNLELFIQKNADITSKILDFSLAIITSAGKGVFLMIFSIIICGIFLAFTDNASSFSRKLFHRLMGSTKSDMTSIAASTIRSVIKGVFGVTIIQSSLTAIGLFAAGIPAAGLLTLFCFILGITQIGLLPVTLGVIIYAWTSLSSFTATALTIWMLLVGLSDNFIKPWVLSKGSVVPMPILLIGSLGGFIYSGFIGLFTGAVIFALGYKLFIAWVEGGDI
jgi:predicted PurR-regulated permease PerM